MRGRGLSISWDEAFPCCPKYKECDRRLLQPGSSSYQHDDFPLLSSLPNVEIEDSGDPLTSGRNNGGRSAGNVSPILPKFKFIRGFTKNSRDRALGPRVTKVGFIVQESTY